MGIAGQERLGVVEEVPSPQKKSRRKLPGEGKVREGNAAGLKERAASEIPELLRKLPETKLCSRETRQRNRIPGSKETCDLSRLTGSCRDKYILFSVHYTVRL